MFHEFKLFITIYIVKTIKNFLSALAFIGAILVGVKIYKDKSEEVVENEEYRPNKRRVNYDRKRSLKASGFKEKMIPLNSRQEEILKHLSLKKIIEMKDIKSFFPEVTTRTLRRDMNKLEDSGMIKREGSTKASKYILK